MYLEAEVVVVKVAVVDDLAVQPRRILQGAETVAAVLSVMVGVPLNCVAGPNSRQRRRRHGAQWRRKKQNQGACSEAHVHDELCTRPRRHERRALLVLWVDVVVHQLHPATDGWNRTPRLLWRCGWADGVRHALPMFAAPLLAAMGSADGCGYGIGELSVQEGEGRAPHVSLKDFRVLLCRFDTAIRAASCKEHVREPRVKKPAAHRRAAAVDPS